MKSMIAGLFYRYRKPPSFVSSNLVVGDVYRLKIEYDDPKTFKKEIVLTNAMGEIFQFNCSYEDLDSFRLEEVFDEVPEPSWWSRPAQFSGY